MDEIMEEKQEQILEQLKTLTLKIDRVEIKVDDLSKKLNKHIGFIDETYEGLKNPILAAKRFLGRK
tara:strand:+ start:630 stop:827 length:198 start_codon:yes stop_codon:yes gene_type:complete